MNSVKKVTTMAAGTKKQSFSHGDSGAVGYGLKSSGSFAPMNHPNPGVSAYVNNSAVQHGKVARNFIPINNNRPIKQQPGIPKRAAYTAQDMSQNVVPQDVHSGYHPFVSQHQHQQSMSAPQGHLNQSSSSSYDTRRYLSSSTQGPIGSLVGSRSQVQVQEDQSQQANYSRASYDTAGTILSPRGERRQGSINAYQSNELMNSIILGDEGHRNNYLSELRGHSPEVYPMDSYNSINMRNSNSSSLLSFAPPQPPSSSSSYGMEKQGYPILGDITDRGFIGAHDRDSTALNIDSFFSHRGIADFANSNASDKSSRYGSYLDSDALM